MTILKAKHLFYWFGLLLLFTACQPDEPFTIDEDVHVEIEESTSAPANFQQLLDKVNDLRSTGCRCGTQQMPPVGSLRWNSQLTAAAAKHSQDMASNQHFNHTGTDGSNAGDRLLQQGYRWQTYGENIAQGYTTVASVFQGWKDSPGHCRNIMNAKFEEMGAAVSNLYWTQVLAAEL